MNNENLNNKVRIKEHQKVMMQILKGLQTAPIVLKGGTALLFCYNLDRHSEDLDFDSPIKFNLQSKILRSVQNTNIEITNLKVIQHTEKTSRYKLNYNSQGIDGTLKIELKNGISIDDHKTVNGIRTYSVNTLFDMKLKAANLEYGRAKIRDVYDLGHILKHYKSELTQDQLIHASQFNQELSKNQSMFQLSHEQDDILRNIPLSKIIKTIDNALQTKENFRGLSR